MTVDIIASNAFLTEVGALRAKPTALTPELREASAEVWKREDGGASVGFWECTPGRFAATREGYTEVCQLLSGRVTVTTDGGEPVTLAAGDTLVMPSGWSGVWEVHEMVRKTYILIDD